MKTIVVIGGAGYIGSHTAFLLSQKYNVIVLDNYSHNQVFKPLWAKIIKADYADTAVLETIFLENKIEAVMQFAGSIEVSESVKNPLKFYKNNVGKTIILLQTMLKYNVKKIIFSSSCSVYGTPQFLPLTEDHPINPISPYGETKSIIENILRDTAESDGLQYVCLRYFNAAGALPEKGLGEQHKPETHIIPLLLQSALTGQPFNIYGSDYNTHDGTAIRDYLHVYDIASAHLDALDYLKNDNLSNIFNLGTGKGYSVKEIIDTVQSIVQKKINILWTNRRDGDPPILLADPTKAQTTLQWTPKNSDLKTIIQSALAFSLTSNSDQSQNHKEKHSNNPKGMVI